MTDAAAAAGAAAAAQVHCGQRSETQVNGAEGRNVRATENHPALTSSVVALPYRQRGLHGNTVSDDDEREEFSEIPPQNRTYIFFFPLSPQLSLKRDTFHLIAACSSSHCAPSLSVFHLRAGPEVCGSTGSVIAVNTTQTRTQAGRAHDEWREKSRGSRTQFQWRRWGRGGGVILTGKTD